MTMIPLSTTLKHLISESFYRAWNITIAPSEVEITKATKREFGHYQCNRAMSLAGILKKKPHEIAQKVIDVLKESPEAQKIISKIEIKGPGFINFWIQPSFLASSLFDLKIDSMESSGSKGHVVIDFSSPNIAKQMHVGHLRSTIIGDCLARIFRYSRWKVSSINHVGDWGTQFGMLIAYIEKEFSEEEKSQWLENSDHMDLESLMNLYKSARALFEADEEFASLSKQTVIRLQAKAEREIAFWKAICEVSRRDFNKIYSLLGIENLVEMGESFYSEFLLPIVSELKASGVAIDSHGAQCVFIEGYKLPFMIQKSDGGFNYDTTDMAALKYRVEKMKADRIVYVTDAGQRLHFELLFASVKKAKWIEENYPLDHVPFGLVLGEDGKKFKTRSGKTEKLIDLLNEATSRVLNIVKTRQDIPEQEQMEIAKRLAISAVKYADLSNDRISDYRFSYDKMLSFEGNTAIFLIYTYVRALSILRRLDGDSYLLNPISLENESEIDLALKLLQFSDAVESSLEALSPHRLADYLWGLANEFNAFFRDCRVAGSSEEASRAHLVEKFIQVMGKGLELLGLQTVEKM